MVWDAVEGVNTKGTYPIISGRINDIAWDGDSQRIIAVGDGREMVSWIYFLKIAHIKDSGIHGHIFDCIKPLIHLVQFESCY